MPEDPRTIDRMSAHRVFSVECFNRAWELIERPERTPAEEEEMLRLAMTSHYHWTQRPDYDAEKASIAYWQISRVFALLGQAENTRRFGERARDVLDAEGDPFLLGYAHEALARAAALARKRERAGKHLAAARRYAVRVDDEESRKLLLADLESIDPV